MGLFDWIVLGAFGTLIYKEKKSNDLLIEEREKKYQKLRNENKKFLDEIDQLEREHKRKSEVNNKRKNTPCLFLDGITLTEFVNIAKTVAERIKRIKSIEVYGPVIKGTVISQSGYSDWYFSVDFNNWGHIDGTYWTYSNNMDSTIPKHFGACVSSEISELIRKKKIRVVDFSNLVDKNKLLETTNVENKKKRGFIERLFYKEESIRVRYNSEDLKGEHLYPVVSALKDNGYNNIKTVPIKDINKKSKKYKYEVEQIILAGTSFFEVGDTYGKDSEIIVTYHLEQEIILDYKTRDYKGRNYVEVGDRLMDLGFVTIYECPIKDLVTGWITKDGAVEKIHVGGKEYNSSKRKKAYKYDTEIIIFYHTFKQ